MQVCHFLLVQDELDGSFNRVEVAMEGRDLVWVESSTGVVNDMFPIPGQSLKCEEGTLFHFSITSLVPSPPPFFVLRFSFSIILGSGRAPSSTSMYYTERKPKNKKRGRPGNEATPLLSLPLWPTWGTPPHCRTKVLLIKLAWVGQVCGIQIESQKVRDLIQGQACAVC